MEFLVKKVQIKTLEKIIEEKYSKHHARVFRVLDNLGYLDEKQVKYSNNSYTKLLFRLVIQRCYP